MDTVLAKLAIECKRLQSAIASECRGTPAQYSYAPSPSHALLRVPMLARADQSAVTALFGSRPGHRSGTRRHRPRCLLGKWTTRHGEADTSFNLLHGVIVDSYELLVHSVGRLPGERRNGLQLVSLYPRGYIGLGRALSCVADTWIFLLVAIHSRPACKSGDRTTN